ncbi:MAG TPA: hypothetical protein VFQ48_02295, partial [Pseudonocardiaceae bacterium]|nr:hypothetical protein [Pseudonocardiaceae bacterium]
MRGGAGGAGEAVGFDRLVGRLSRVDRVVRGAGTAVSIGLAGRPIGLLGTAGVSDGRFRWSLPL